MQEQPLLNEAQKRSLNTALRLLEERLFYVELLLKNGPYRGILFNLEIDLNKNQREQLENTIKKLKRLIAQMKNILELKVKNSDLSSLLQSSAIYFWTIFEDEQPEKLKRYGAVHQNLHQVLQPLLQELIATLKKMESL